MLVARRLWRSITRAVTRAVPVVADDEWVGDAGPLARADVAMLAPAPSHDPTRSRDNTPH
ncbi:MAG: hypothetical protein U0Y82_04915 [Thermoleophilia bacterium]